jgi:class 3 adenylate cyclase
MLRNLRMLEREEFTFERSRGIVWICDMADSSRYLNDDASADDLEAFLPRLYWVASGLVEAAGGRLVKWTGDGFIAWFETGLYRQLGEQAAQTFFAAWQLAFLVNVTQLGCKPKRKFAVRHGIAFEHDALLIHITHHGGYRSLDLVGRSVTLASRLAGIKQAFPGIVTQRELVFAARKSDSLANIHFTVWQPTSEDLIRYFKNESWGTRSIYVSASGSTRLKTQGAIKRLARKIMDEVETPQEIKSPNGAFIVRWLEYLDNGPEWCKEILKEQVHFVRTGFLPILKEILELQPTAIDIEKRPQDHNEQL